MDLSHKLGEAEDQIQRLEAEVQRLTQMLDLEDDAQRELQAEIDQLTAQCNERDDLEGAVDALCDLLRASLGLERLEDTPQVHDLFRALERVDDVRRPWRNVSEDLKRLRHLQGHEARS